MGKSARILGDDYGLSSQEMNYILNKKGFLDGEPGNYFPSELGKKFATQKDFHCGTGGYSRFNRYWATTTWDDSIADVLDITPELKAEARQAVANRRRMHAEARRVETELADIKFRKAQEALQSATTSDNTAAESSKGVNGWAVAAVGLGIAAVGYGIYKAAPHVKSWWTSKVAPFFTGKEPPEEE